MQAATRSMQSSSPSSSSNGAPPTSSGSPKPSRESSRPVLTGLPRPRRTCCATRQWSARSSGSRRFATESSDVSATLHSLERKGFVRRQKRSSVEGETEFAFAHALVRDVAYGQIARADRAEKHRRCRGVDREPRPPGRSCRDGRTSLAIGVRARSCGRCGGRPMSPTALALPSAKPATARPPSTRIRRRRSTTRRHSISGRTAILSARICCFVALGRSILPRTIVVRRPGGSR